MLADQRDRDLKPGGFACVTLVLHHHLPATRSNGIDGSTTVAFKVSWTFAASGVPRPPPGWAKVECTQVQQRYVTRARPRLPLTASPSVWLNPPAAVGCIFLTVVCWSSGRTLITPHASCPALRQQISICQTTHHLTRPAAAP